MATEPTIVFRDERLCGASWGALFFEVWSAEGTPSHFRTMRAQQVTHARAQPDQKIVLFSVVKMTSIPRLDIATRREIDARTKTLSPHLLAGVVVLPAQGFAASVVRSLVAGLSLLRRASYPTTVSSSLDDALRWVVQHLPPEGGRPVTVDDARRACEAASRPGPNVGALVK